VDKELLLLMRRAGCYQLSVGFETNHQVSLDASGKGIMVAQSEFAAKAIKDAGIELVGLFMLGMPGDTVSSIKSLSEFAITLRVDYAQFNQFDFSPGAPIYEDYLKDRSRFVPARISRKYASLSSREFYFRPRKIFQIIKKINSPGDIVFFTELVINSMLHRFSYDEY